MEGQKGGFVRLCHPGLQENLMMVVDREDPPEEEENFRSEEGGQEAIHPDITEKNSTKLEVQFLQDATLYRLNFIQNRRFIMS